MLNLRMLAHVRQSTYARLVSLSLRSFNRLSPPQILQNESVDKNTSISFNVARKMGMFSHGNSTPVTDSKET